ncbi:MAG: hypothetical protein IJ960_07685 [Oscillospiraceae bacterium]|nr:hypothetical protein [Oscillospiraceae bacterium]
MNEQDILFEVQYKDTQELMEEIFKHISTKTRRIYGTVFSVGCLIFLPSIFVLGGKYIFWFLFSLGYLIFILTRHKLYARRYIKQMMTHYDGVMPDQFFRFTEDTVYSVQGDLIFHLPLRKLTRATATRNTLNLYAGKTHRLTIVKVAFIKGSYQEFLAFLRAKCPDLVLPE